VAARAARDHRLRGKPESGRIQEAAAAEVIQDQQIMPAGDGYQFRETYLAGKAQQAEITGMHTHQGDRTLTDGLLKITGVGAVGRAHLNEPGAALAHDIRDAKAAADFHRLAAGNDDLFAAGQGRQSQQHPRRIIIHDQRRLRAGKPAQ
jgi:hypothetical protein